MSIRFADATEFYTGTLPAIISLPWTIVMYQASTYYNDGTFRWGVRFSGANDIRFGQYSASPAFFRGADISASVLNVMTGAMAATFLTASANGGNTDFNCFDHNGNQIFNLGGGVQTLPQTIRLNHANFFGSNTALGYLAIYQGTQGTNSTFRGLINTGASPLLIEPQNLRHFWPLVNAGATELDVVGGVALTRTNSPVAVAQRLISPKSVTTVRGTTIDVTAPTVSSSTINTAGNQLSVVFDEPVTGNTGLTITPSGGAATLTYSSGMGTNTLVYSISRVIYGSETVTRAYTPGNITDIATNALGSFSDVSVTNNSTQIPDVIAPTLTSVTITAATTLTLVFSEAVNITDVTGLTIASSGSAVTISSPSGSGTNTLTFTLSRSIIHTESLAFSYDSGTGNIADLASNVLATISGRLVTNNITGSSGGVSLIGQGLIQ